MKTTNFLAIAIIAVASVTSNVVAQRTSEKTSEAKNTIGSNSKSAGWDLRKTEVRIVATEDGCEIRCSSRSSTDSSGGGMAVGKQKNTNTETQIESIKLKLKEVFISSHQISNVNEEETSTNAVATGKHFKDATISMKSSADGSHIPEAKLAARQGSSAGSGKVNVQDISFRKSSGSGSGKVNVQDLSFTVKCKGKPVAITIDNNGFTMPENCPDGTYDMVASWSWGAHQSGSTSNKAIDCHLKIENGVCVDMAINEKGTSGTKSTR